MPKAAAHAHLSLSAIASKRREMIENAFSTVVNMRGGELSRRAEPFPMTGRVHKALGTIIHASIPDVSIGEIVELQSEGSSPPLLAECIGFLDRHALLSPIGETLGVSHLTEVRRTSARQQVPVSEGLVGRVLDGLGQPIDGKGPISPEAHYDLYADPPPALSRQIINSPLSLGVRALDGLLTCGEGQRMGIFAAAGVGKSVLLSMLARAADADVIVLALIGERGREVREFIELGLGEGRERCVTVVATSDQSAMERLKAALTATAVAEYFRDKGRKVLFLMDSVTRFARAAREIGLAAGDPPTRRGYPPSVFTLLPKLMERTGMGSTGSITALYTVLMEGEDLTDPIAEEVRSILDGHIVLSQKMAAVSHYPAIDILASKSRVMPLVTSVKHRQWAARVVSWLATYAENELLLRVGEYQRGNDADLDEAIDRRPEITAFLRQDWAVLEEFDTTLGKLQELVE